MTAFPPRLAMAPATLAMALAALGAATALATPASAQLFNAHVDEDAFGRTVPPASISTTTNTVAALNGKVGADLHTPGHGADTYAARASAGHLSVASHLTANARGNIDGAHTDVNAQIQDRLTLKGAPAGKNLILHKTVAVHGGASFTEAFTGPNSAIETSSDVRIDGGGDAIFAEAPFFPALGGNPVDATSRHTDSNAPGPLPVSRDLFAPASIDYSILFFAGQSATVLFGLQLVSEAVATGGGVSSFTGAYDLDFDTGPGFFTLADANGHDTGLRLGSNFTVSGASGFNYFAAAGQGLLGDGDAGDGGLGDGAAVPEPAAWALMITGFTLSGAMLRWRRRGAAAAALA